MDKTVDLKLTANEINSLITLLDAGLRSIGLRGAREAAILIEKIEKAANEKVVPEGEYNQ